MKDDVNLVVLIFAHSLSTEDAIRDFARARSAIGFARMVGAEGGGSVVKGGVGFVLRIADSSLAICL